MAGDTNDHYSFLAIYESQQLEFQLPEYCTVEDVKLQIYEKFKVRPSQQTIEGWAIAPDHENQPLGAFLLSKQNVLWVLSTDKTNECVENNCSVGNYSELSSMLQGNPTEENTSEVSDVEACVSFIAQFIAKYGDNHISFHNCSLKEAIVEVCFAPVESRKILVLYFHNDDDAFSQMFCPTLVNGGIRNIFESSYYMIGWDVGNELYHSALKKSLDDSIDFEVAQSMIAEKRAALLIVYPIENSITIFSMLHGAKVKSKDVLTALQEIEKNFKVEIQNEIELQNIKENAQTQNDIGPNEFQQLMHDRLGDRDYDSFEYDEHEYLKQKIGFAKYGPPKREDGYDKKQKKNIEETYKQIREYNNKYAEWEDQVIVSFIYNCLEPMPEEKIARAKKYPDYNPSTDVSPIPLYVIRKCCGSENPCRIFIGSDNRVYNSWKDYIEDNKLHKCTMVLPLGGRYVGDENGIVLLERHMSPACGIGHAVLKGADIATTLAGLASGGVFVVAMIPAIAVAPVALTAAAVTGMGVGVYSLIRSAVNIYDRHAHGESMSFANSEARGAYINIVAGTLGFVGAGATTAVSHLASRGVNLGQGARMAVDTIGVLNISTSGVSVVNSTYQVVNDWVTEQQTPSLLTVVQLSSSILFFGNAVYNFRTAGSIIEESQTHALQTYNDSLRSNKHRKMLDKLVKETVRQNSGDVGKARAAVISTIRKISNKDEVFAILNRNNKLFNKERIRFSAENGEIKLNGVSVDLFEFGSMSNTQRSDLLIDLPSTPQPSPAESNANTTRTMNTISTVFELDTIGTVLKYGQLITSGCSFAKLAAATLQDFSSIVQEKILRICKALIDALFGTMDFLQISTEYFSFMGSDPFAVVLRFVIDFLKTKMNAYEVRYEEEKEEAKQLPGFNEDTFNRKWGVLPDTGKRALYWFEQSVHVFVMGEAVDQFLLRELIQYVMNVVTEKVYDHCDAEEKRGRREEHTKRNLHKTVCNVCGGYYYSANSS